MKPLLVRVLALAAAALAGIVIGAIAEWIIARHDDRPSLAAGHRRALDDDSWTG